jgi:hypothetical protein
MKYRWYLKSLMMLFSITMALVCISCIDEDIANISDSAILSPEYSIPLGRDVAFAEDFVQFFDTLGTGTPYYFYYNDSLFIDWDGIFTFYESVAIDFSSLVNIDTVVKAAMLRLNIYNSTSGSVDIQVYMVDGIPSISDSLFESPVRIDPGHTGSDGRVDGSSYTRAEVYYTAEQWQQLLTIRNVLISGNVRLSQSDTLMFYNTDSVNIQLALRLYLEGDVADL